MSLMADLLISITEMFWNFALMVSGAQASNVMRWDVPLILFVNDFYSPHFSLIREFSIYFLFGEKVSTLLKYIKYLMP